MFAGHRVGHMELSPLNHFGQNFGNEVKFPVQIISQNVPSLDSAQANKIMTARYK
jgi:hypothetical protein